MVVAFIGPARAVHASATTIKTGMAISGKANA